MWLIFALTGLLQPLYGTYVSDLFGDAGNINSLSSVRYEEIAHGDAVPAASAPAGRYSLRSGEIAKQIIWLR